MATSSQKLQTELPTVQLRLGVALPDWSVIRSDGARRALSDIVRLFGLERCFDGYGVEEDRVRQALIILFGKLGRAPTTEELVDEAGLSPDTVTHSLASLRARDLVVLGTDGEVVGAYPFSGRDTGHRVRLGDHTVNAMCAVDALGVGSMYGQDVLVMSACRQCSAPITIQTRNRGRGIALTSPRDASVFNGVFYDGQAARSLCTVIAFFCSDQHLHDWSAERRDLKGHHLSIGEALEIGRAIFDPVLDIR